VNALCWHLRWKLWYSQQKTEVQKVLTDYIHFLVTSSCAHRHIANMENVTWFQNRLTCARKYRRQSSRLRILTRSSEWSVTVNNSHILKKTVYARIKRSVQWPKSKLAACRRTGVCSLVRFSTHIEPTNCSEALGSAMVKVEWDCFPCAIVALPPLTRVMAGWLLPPSSECSSCCFHVVSWIQSFRYIVRTIPNLTAKLLATRPKRTS